MKNILKYHLYIIGFAILAAAAVWLNWNCPPNYDEAHAWNIARHLSTAEIFTVSKTEGHPFLWYYLLMPLAKANLLYPYSLYFLNLLLVIGAFCLLYRYAPFPAYVKYLITFSAPFLQLYAGFARSYTLSVFLLFSLLSFYPSRQKHPVFYLFLLLLLANTNLMGFWTAFPLGFIYFTENLCSSLRNKRLSLPLFLTINAALLEILLIVLQFYGYNADIPKYTPVFHSLQEDLNMALFPLNIHVFFGIILLYFFFFLKQKQFAAAFFLASTMVTLALTFSSVYHGAIHHHNFFYICLIAACWLEKEKSAAHSPSATLLLGIIALLLIFNPYNQYKKKDCAYLRSLQNSAVAINQLFPGSKQQILVLEHFDANIIKPYLSPNIKLLNQTMTDFSSLKAFQETLYHFYRQINRYKIIETVTQTPDTLLYRTCGENTYRNDLLAFRLKYRLNSKYCLYTIEIR